MSYSLTTFSPRIVQSSLKSAVNSKSFFHCHSKFGIRSKILLRQNSISSSSNSYSSAGFLALPNITHNPYLSFSSNNGNKDKDKYSSFSKSSFFPYFTAASVFVLGSIVYFSRDDLIPYSRFTAHAASAKVADSSEVTALAEEDGKGGKVVKSKDKSKIGKDEEGDGEGEGKPEKKSIGFNARRMIEYENRIRKYSTPDKIFRYFATLKVFQGKEVEEELRGEMPAPGSPGGDVYEVFMTPDDFMHALTPGVAPQPKGLQLDQFKKYDPRRDHLKLDLSKDSIFYEFGPLISFSDFVFLLTLLAVSDKQFKIAFRMFDLNGNGEISFEEFQKVRDAVRNTTATGKRHRDNFYTGNSIMMQSGLTRCFFGPNFDRTLTLPQFLDFIHRLKHEVLSHEFKLYSPDENGLITEKNFAKALIVYSNIPSARIARMIQRVGKKFKKGADDAPGISFKDYQEVSVMLDSIRDIERALSFHKVAGLQFDKSTFKHVTKIVADIDLNDHVVDVIFTTFDENGDGLLSHEEFVAVMRDRHQRGLERPKEMGVGHAAERLLVSAINKINEYFFGKLPDEELFADLYEVDPNQAARKDEEDED